MPIGEGLMTETITAPPRPKSTQGSSTDKDVLAQVEKWMAIIREVSREKAKS